MKRFGRGLIIFLLLFCAATIANASGAYREGDEGEDVTQIQARLSALGYQVSVDGDFGPATTEAIKAFQRDRGLEADGIVGAMTYKALMGRDIPVSRNASTSAVRRIMQNAMRLTGVPYVFGGTTPGGFDCSGFVRYVFNSAGIALPRTADAQFDAGQPVSLSRLQPGDLVFYTTYAEGPSHNGIYIGEGKFIHASSSRGVTVDRMDSSYWRNRYYGARRML
jgi:cell wall-associated NlpC family hydrolase